MSVVVCAVEMVLRLASVSMDVDALIDLLNCHAAHSQKSARSIFCKTSVALAERLQTFFPQKIAILFSSVDEAAIDVETLLQNDAAHCQSTARELLEPLVDHGSARSQDGPSGLQGGLSAPGCPSAQSDPPLGQ